MPARAAAARTTSHSTFGDMPSPQTRPALLMARKTVPCLMLAASVHASTVAFTQLGDRHRAHVAALADEVRDHPVVLSLLD
jgi:hypothetical protein